MLATCIHFFPLQGTPLIFQKREQQVEVLHLKIAKTLCCSISSDAKRSYPHHVWLHIWASKASRRKQHTYTQLLDARCFPNKMYKILKLQPIQLTILDILVKVQLVYWCICSCFSLEPVFPPIFDRGISDFGRNSAVTCRLTSCIRLGPAKAGHQTHLHHILSKDLVTQNKWICTDVNIYNIYDYLLYIESTFHSSNITYIILLHEVCTRRSSYGKCTSNVLVALINGPFSCPNKIPKWSTCSS